MAVSQKNKNLQLLVDFSSNYLQNQCMLGSLVKRIQNGKSFDFSRAESIVIHDYQSLSQKTLQVLIDGFGVGDIGPSLITRDGKTHTCKRVCRKIIKTLVGPIIVNRTGYYQKGQSLLFPLDACLNLPLSSFSYQLQYRLAYESARGSFSDASDSFYQSNKIKIHKQSIEEIAVAVSQDFDGFYEQKVDPKKLDQVNNLPIIVLSLDSKGIVMRKEDLTEGTRKAAELSKPKLKHRLTSGEKLNRKRMATAAAVYSIDRYVRTPADVTNELEKTTQDKAKKRPKPVFKRVWARIEATSEEVTDDVFSEAIKRDKDLNKTWVVLIDGDLNQLRRTKKRIRKINKSALICLDIIHVIEYLWRAGRAFFETEHQKCESWVKAKLTEILNGSAGYAAGGIRRSGTLQKLTGNRKKEVNITANYILKNTQYMKYDEYLSQGLPIASGVIEGVCRHVIKDRMDLTGARWTMRGAEATLKLRSIKASGDFEDFWAFHEQAQFNRNYVNIDICFDSVKSI